MDEPSLPGRSQPYLVPTLQNNPAGVYQALPGPEAAELACYFGLIAKGYAGALIGGLWCASRQGQTALKLDRSCFPIPARASSSLAPRCYCTQFHSPRFRNHDAVGLPLHPLASRSSKIQCVRLKGKHHSARGRLIRAIKGDVRMISGEDTPELHSEESAHRTAGPSSGLRSSSHRSMAFAPVWLPAFALKATLKLRCGCCRLYSAGMLPDCAVSPCVASPLPDSFFQFPFQSSSSP